MTTSCQPRPQPHSSGIAAIRATSGTATNTPTRKRWADEVGSSSMSGLGVRDRVLAVPPLAPSSEAGAAARSVVAGGRAVAVASATLTMSGEVVIVLLLVRTVGAGAPIRLRNRSLRNRRLGNTSLGISANRRLNFLYGRHRR